MQAPERRSQGPPENRPYDAAVARKLTKPRPRQGARLAALRRKAGLSQADLGQLIGESQQNVAFWEQSEKPPRSDVLPRLADVLGVEIAELLEPGRRTGAKKGGPVGRVRRVFEEVSRLPRRQQDKVIEVVDAMIQQYRQRKTG